MSTLKQLTKAQLIDLVQDRNAEIQGLRLELSIATRNRSMPRAVTTEQLSFQQRCNAARALAMRTGKAVAVAKLGITTIPSSSATELIAQNA